MEVNDRQTDWHNDYYNPRSGGLTSGYLDKTVTSLAVISTYLHGQEVPSLDSWIVAR